MADQALGIPLQDPQEDEDFNFKCTFCLKNLSSRQNLREHLYIHTGERPYVCSEPGCGQSFRQGSLLSIHKRIHAEVKKGVKVEKVKKKVTFLSLTRILKKNNDFHHPLCEEVKSSVLNSLDCERFSFIKQYLPHLS
jgi:uncharacterized Zn-finger protein